MTFPSVAPARRSPTILDHLVLIAVFALPMLAARTAHSSDMIELSLIMLLLGYLLWWLPGLGTRGRWHDILVLPAYMALTMVDLVLAFIAIICDPDAAVLVIGAQLIALVYVSFRS
jgi:hypothetical protein